MSRLTAAVLPTASPPTATLRLEILLGSLTAIAPLSIDMYVPAFSAIGGALHVDTAAIQLTLAAFFVGFAGAQLLAGPIVDRFGRKRPLLIGLFVYVVGSVLCALAPSLPVLIAGRVIAALGGAFAVVVPRAVVRDLVSGAEAAKMFSRLLLVMGVAPIVAPLLGGWLLVHVGWRSIFVVLSLAGVVLFVAAAVALPATTTSRAPSSTPAWRGVLSDRRFVRFTLAGGCAQAAMFAYISGSSFVLIERFGVAADDYGFFFGANAAALIFASQLNRRLLTDFTPEAISRWSGRAVVVTAGLVAVAGIATSSLWALAAALFVFLGTLGFVTPNTGAIALEGQGARAGMASAMMGFSQFALAAVAAAAVSALHDGSAAPMVGVMVVFATISWLLLETARHETT